jgi:hypothetical protein
MRLFQGGGDGGVKVELITPASAAAVSGAAFANSKRCDAFGGQLHAMVSCFVH